MDFSPLSYRETAPSAELSRIILSFWEFRVMGGDFPQMQHEVFPDGCISLIYYRNRKFNTVRVFLNGLNLESVSAPVFPCDVFWAMRISPAACAGVLRGDPGEALGRHFWENKGAAYLLESFKEKLDLCENFEEAVAVFENEMRQINFGQNIFDQKIAAALELIEENVGEIKISELAARLGLSTRQLERRFKRHAGLSPKQFVRARRIRAAAVDLAENKSLNWARLAAEMGFTDQSHLNRELTAVTKRSPRSFAEKVKNIDHGRLIK